METLDEFLDAIYGDTHGYSYVATKEKDGAWNQRFFEWPKERESLEDFVQQESKTKDVYYGPALYSRPQATKGSIRDSRVFWCEFDGTVPETLDGIPRPHIRVRSSKDGHEHWYWKTPPVGLNELERINRRLAYYLGADTSGWDATQVLRPPGTKNFKNAERVRDVTIISTRPGISNFTELDASLPTAPEIVEIPIATDLPPLEEVVAKYAFPEETFKLLRSGSEEGDRSKDLMHLGYAVAELGMTDDEILSILVNADTAWGKFKDRPDRLIRLAEIVTRCREKYPDLQSKSTSLNYYGFTSLIENVPEVEWAWEGLLEKGGTLLLSGPPGIGKTQFALNMCMHFSLGEDFLGFKVPRPYRVAFFSLEMGQSELLVFYRLLQKNYKTGQLEVLDKNFLTFPVGEPMYLTNAAIQIQVEEIVERLELDGVIFDSLGSTTSESLLSDSDARQIMDWNDRFRNRYGVFTGYIHHNRKASGDNKRPNKLADVYGSVYFQARPTTIICLWENRQDASGNSLECIPLKVRLAPKPSPFIIQRSFNLNYTRKEQGTILPPKRETKVPDKQESRVVQPGRPGIGFG